MSPIISHTTAHHTEFLYPCTNTVHIKRTELDAARFVQNLHIRSHLKGYSYLITAIVLGKNNPHLLSSLTQLLYPAVASVYNTTPTAVERNIRTTIDLAAQHDPEHLQSVFYYRTRKPYISEVLSLALETIRLNAYEAM